MVDRIHILEMLKSGLSVSEISETTGAHENTVRAISRAKRGVCVRCQKKTAPMRTLCADCLEWDRQRMRKIRAKRRHDGLCIQCGAPRTGSSRHYCDAHRLTALKRSFLYAGRQKALHRSNVPMRGSAWGMSYKSQKDRRRRLKEKYGEAGWDRWQHAGGCCELCAAKYGDVAIHIHHIDEDQSNNTFENFVCLCFDCHHAVHHLLKSKNRIGLVAWFEKTYPDHRLR